MARLRIAAFIGLGILIAVAILPQTRWLLLNDLAALQGRSLSQNYYGCLDSRNWPADTADHQLARAIHYRDPESPSKQLEPLVTFCREHPNDASAWAHLLRIASAMSWHSPEEPKPKVRGVDLEGRKSRDAVMALAIENGERLEPDNVYFTAMKIGLLESQGKRPEAQAALLDAGRKRSYNDHAIEEGKLDYDAAQSACGFRGIAMEVDVQAAIILPHLNCMRLIPYVAAGKPELQMAALRTAHTIGKAPTYGFVVLSMAGVFDRALLKRPGSQSKADPDELRAAALTLDKRLGGSEARDYLIDFQQVDYGRIERLPDNSSLTDFFYRQTRPPIFAEIVLFSLIGVVPLAYAAAALSRGKLWLLRRQDVPERPTLWSLWTALLVVAVACLFIGQYRTENAWAPVEFGLPPPERVSGDVLILASLLLLGLSVLVIPRRGARPGSAIALLFAVLPIFYLGHLVVELREDKGLERIVNNIPNEVEIVRGHWTH